MPAPRIKISVFIIARDEADRIGAAIRSVEGVADEVIVVDSGSTEGTMEAAEALGARALFNSWTGYGPQKRFAEDHCRHDWLLNIDADERLSDALREEIMALEGEADGYRIDIKDRVFFEKTPHPLANSYKPVRLYRRAKGRYANAIVHDRVEMAEGARIADLKAKIFHDSRRSLTHSIAKANAYTSMQAQVLKDQGRRANRLRLLTEFPLSFFKAYVSRRYCIYGLWGFVMAMDYAFFRLVRLAKRYEMELRERSSSEDDSR